MFAKKVPRASLTIQTGSGRELHDQLCIFLFFTYLKCLIKSFPVFTEYVIFMTLSIKSLFRNVSNNSNVK